MVAAVEEATREVVIVDYDPEWPAVFQRLCAQLERALGGLEFELEHVGSTAVPGLCAKPIIDIDVIVDSAFDAAKAIERLAFLGYVHQGNQGIEGREAVASPDGSPARHVYVCLRGSAALENHLIVRDRLRADPAVASAYGTLKKQLAQRFSQDADQYAGGKTAFLVGILRGAGVAESALASIAAMNRQKL